MSDRTSIEWAANADGSPGASWNPIRARAKNRASGSAKTAQDGLGWFCIHESEGCRNCYAERLNRRLGTGIPYKAQNEELVDIILDENTLTQPLRWKKPRTIFVCSMSDLFGRFVSDEMIDRVFAVAALCPQHTFIVLTKRPQRMRHYLVNDHQNDATRWLATTLPTLNGPRQLFDLLTEGRGQFTHISFPLPNVWLGTSAEDQPTADKRIPDLFATPAAVRFVSLEPLLGRIDLSRVCIGSAGFEGFTPDLADIKTARFVVDALKGADSLRWPALDWVIAGGESGPDARPMHPDWARSLRDQCAAAGVPFFYKQHGEWIPGEVYAIGVSLGHTRCADGEEHGGKPTHWWSGDVNGGVISVRVGKRVAGRFLDGREHNDRPPLSSQPRSTST